jgi:hypothetical protein
MIKLKKFVIIIQIIIKNAIQIQIKLIFIVIVRVVIKNAISLLAKNSLKNTFQENLKVKEQVEEKEEIEIYIITILIFFIL